MIARNIRNCLLFIVGGLVLMATVQAVHASEDELGPIDPQRDYHTYANLDEVVMTHIYFNLNADFDKSELGGYIDLTLKHKKPGVERLVLDSSNLVIHRAQVETGGEWVDTSFELSEPADNLGSALTIKIQPKTRRVRIYYNTIADGEALSWASPEQTHDKNHPYMYSLAQTIYGRQWFPHQDTPAIRVTYSADITTPKDLRALMSANNDRDAPVNGKYHFEMPSPLVTYLISIAVGDLEFRAFSDRSGVYAEPGLIDKAEWEFAETEVMIKAIEGLYGDYPWGRYDLLIMPPSFPFGGMEHANLSFITPTVITGDRGLTELITHELAHSWSGNLVTNGTWRDLWLNEGFTEYVQNRATAVVYSEKRAKMELASAYDTLLGELEELDEPDQIMAIDLRGQHPDNVFTDIPYAKAELFLRFLENRVGQDTFDTFVNGYFEQFAWRTITTDVFEAYLYENLLAKNPGAFTRAEIEEWIHQPGYPSSGIKPTSAEFDKVDVQVDRFVAGDIAARDIDTSRWKIHQWERFVAKIPDDLPQDKFAEMDAAFKLTQTSNLSLLNEWLVKTISAGYMAPARERMNNFLSAQGRIAYTKRIFLNS